MRMSRSRIFIAFLIGSAVNIILFSLSKYLGFPLWLDYSGSLYLAALCGPVPGLLSAILHTLVLAVLIDGAPALWMLIPLFFCCFVLFYARLADAFVNAAGKMGVLLSVTAAGFAGLLLPVLISGTPGRFEAYEGVFNAMREVCGRFFSAVFISGACAFCMFLPSALIALGLYVITPKPTTGLSFKK